MATKRRNMFYENKKQETTEIVWHINSTAGDDDEPKPTRNKELRDSDNFFRKTHKSPIAVQSTLRNRKMTATSAQYFEPCASSKKLVIAVRPELGLRRPGREIWMSGRRGPRWQPDKSRQPAAPSTGNPPDPLSGQSSAETSPLPNKVCKAHVPTQPGPIHPPEGKNLAEATLKYTREHRDQY
ncbi:hypothetical protein AAG570_003741 [Ranatra chinensis]|uniref:Uncharacterized protein n=1 Tax=Ranatra chinensis TaxID=642074 RepID=A0ABD0Y4H8_9HEMI